MDDLRGKKFTLAEKKELRKARKEKLFNEDEMPPRLKPAMRKESMYGGKSSMALQPGQGTEGPVIPPKKRATWDKAKLERLRKADPMQKDRAIPEGSDESASFKAKKKSWRPQQLLMY